MSTGNPLAASTCGGTSGATGGGGGRLLLARAASSQAAVQLLNSNLHDEDSNQLSVDTDFDSYWEEEARNPHRNRIRIGRQYQATVPAVAAPHEPTTEYMRQYQLERQAGQLETLSFCPTKAAQLSDAELQHYFTVAKSLNLFAELVQTRSLLGRDVTIADLNRIRNKEGLSLASVIQPPANRQPTTSSPPQESPQVSASLQVSPPAAPHSTASSFSPVQSPKEQPVVQDSSSAQPVNQALMRALSHFISLHHPCHHDTNCKKLCLKDSPQEADQTTVSDNLRQVAKVPSSRSRSALKQLSLGSSRDEADGDENVCNSKQANFQEWSREEIELFSKAIEVCGKNFGFIKKEFLPTKSVRSIVEYYYIGLRGDPSGDGSVKRKASQNSLETTSATDATPCSTDKSSPNNNSHGGGPGGSSSGNGSKNDQSSSDQHPNLSSNSDNTASSGGHNNRTHLTSPSATETTSTTKQANNNSDDIHFASSNNINMSKPDYPLHMPDANGIRQPHISTSSGSGSNKTIDARMSVYNFDDEFKEESTNPNPSAVQSDVISHNSALGVKPLKAKPIMPNALIDSDSANSNLGSLKFFMDGQLILKLNACQDQQEGQEKCHWVQSGERLISANSKQKKLTKRPNRLSDGQLVNGSQSNSLVSPFQDDDSKTGEFINDEDSKESLNSSLSQSSNQQHPTINQQTRNQHQHQLTSSPSGNKRLKMTRNTAVDSNAASGALMGQQQLHSPINYNRLSVDNNNRIKENNNTIHSPLNPNSAINQQAAAAAAAMPWLQANSFAMAAALLGQLPFPTNPAPNMVEPPLPPPILQGNINSVTHNLTSKPMDLSLEHTTTTPNKSIQSANNSKSSSRSKSSRPKNS